MSKIYNNKLLKQLAIIGLPIYVAGILYFTLFWRSGGFTGSYSMNINVIPFFWIIEPLFMSKDFYFDQVILNIMMFLPLGMVISFIFKICNMKMVLSASLATTVIIELIQPFFGRCTDIDDVMLNIVGAILGYLIISTFERTISKIRPKRHTVYLPVYKSCLKADSKSVAYSLPKPYKNVSVT